MVRTSVYNKDREILQKNRKRFSWSLKLFCLSMNRQNNCSADRATMSHNIHEFSIPVHNIIHTLQCCSSSSSHQMSAVGARCDLSAADLEFRTPLHWAAVLGNSEMVSLLLEGGGSAHSQDSVGATPLHYAVSQRWCVCVSILCRESELECYLFAL